MTTMTTITRGPNEERADVSSADDGAAAARSFEYFSRKEVLPVPKTHEWNDEYFDGSGRNIVAVFDHDIENFNIHHKSARIVFQWLLAFFTGLPLLLGLKRQRLPANAEPADDLLEEGFTLKSE